MNRDELVTGEFSRGVVKYGVLHERGDDVDLASRLRRMRRWRMMRSRRGSVETWGFELNVDFKTITNDLLINAT